MTASRPGSDSCPPTTRAAQRPNGSLPGRPPTARPLPIPKPSASTPHRTRRGPKPSAGPLPACRRHDRAALFRRAAVPFLVVVARFRFSLGRLDDSVLMLGGAVDGVEAQRLAAGVADIVAGAGRNDHGD